MNWHSLLKGRYNDLVSLHMLKDKISTSSLRAKEQSRLQKTVFQSDKVIDDFEQVQMSHKSVQSLDYLNLKNILLPTAARCNSIIRD